MHALLLFVALSLSPGGSRPIATSSGPESCSERQDAPRTTLLAAAAPRARKTPPAAGLELFVGQELPGGRGWHVGLPSDRPAAPGTTVRLTPASIIGEASFRYRCAGGKATALEFSDLPSPRTVDLAKRGLQSGEGRTSVSLWRLGDARAACDAGRKSLEVRPRVELRCESGEPVVQRPRVVLDLDCGALEQILSSMSEGGVRFEPADLPRGESAELEVFARRFPGRELAAPRTKRVVRLDAGKVVERYPPFFDASRGSGELEEGLRFAVRAQGEALRLAVEVEFEDGSSLQSTPVELPVLAPEKRAERDRELRSSAARDFDLMERIEGWGDPCKQRDEFEAWLRKQPEVEAVSMGEYDISVRTRGGTPILVHCDPGPGPGFRPGVGLQAPPVAPAPPARPR